MATKGQTWIEALLDENDDFFTECMKQEVELATDEELTEAHIEVLRRPGVFVNHRPAPPTNLGDNIPYVTTGSKAQGLLIHYTDKIVSGQRHVVRGYQNGDIIHTIDGIKI